MIGSSNYFVSNTMAQSHFGYAFEGIVQVTVEDGVAKLNGTPINDAFIALVQGQSATMALQIFAAPIMSTAVTTLPISDPGK